MIYIISWSIINSLSFLSPEIKVLSYTMDMKQLFLNIPTNSSHALFTFHIWDRL
ncbi:hypothetical protein HanIR_Chr01g0045081 [Helianthus annuus]|nr:hypothetical protein HanIR_Chr01g0045081 [Helianthus annuus]